MLVSNIKEMTEIGIVHLFDLEDGLLRILMQFEVSKYLVCYTAVFSVVTQHLNNYLRHNAIYFQVIVQRR